MYNAITQSLEGVPSSQNRDLPHNIIITLRKDDIIKLTIPCSVNVYDASLTSSIWYTDDDVTTDSLLRCASNEPVVVASVTLDVKEATLTTKERSNILKNSCPVLKRFTSCDVITLEREVRTQSNSIGSGHLGSKVVTKEPFTKLLWPVACGTESVEPSLLHAITANDTKLLNISGYKILAWNIENRKPNPLSSEHARRIRR